MPATPNPQSGIDGTIVQGDEMANVIPRFFSKLRKLAQMRSTHPSARTARKR